MSLITKYRPSSFDEIVGHADIVESARKLVASDTPPHSWLLVGRTGVGKTTLARIIAKSLGASDHAIQEVNAADIRGIDGIRSILERDAYGTPGSPCKVIVLDECHQLTRDAQNALLKVLEECNPRSFYILCTSEEKKLLETIRSRCTRYKFGALPAAQIIDLLIDVAAKEGYENYTAEMLEPIVVDSGGSARFALNLLERCSSCQSVESVKKLLSNYEEDDELYGEVCGELLKAIWEANSSQMAWRKVKEILKTISRASDYNSMCYTLMARISGRMSWDYQPGMAEVIMKLSAAQQMTRPAFIAAIQLLIESKNRRSEAPKGLRS